MASVGPVAVVFGGTKGIGKAIAFNLLFNRFRVAIGSRGKDNVTETIEELTKAGSEMKNAYENTPSVLGFQCDVSSESEVQTCLRRVEEHWSTPFVVVNAAGINEDNLLIKTNTSTVHSIINTNLIGAIITSKVAARAMMKKHGGSIINIGSVVGLCGNTGQVAYSSSKAALVGLTKSLAKELGSRGIRVNLVAPGFVDTGMTLALKNAALLQKTIPMQRFGKPEEVAEAVRFLISATYITGQVFIIDGGLHLNV